MNDSVMYADVSTNFRFEYSEISFVFPYDQIQASKTGFTHRSDLAWPF